MKTCVRCKTTYASTIEYFSYHKNTKDNLNSWCKNCKNKYSRIYRQEHKEDFRKWGREYARTKRGKEVRQKSTTKQKREHPEKFKARSIITNALHSGKITKPKACLKCGVESRIEGHHTNYNKPFDIMWLCAKCHRKQHRIKR